MLVLPDGRLWVGCEDGRLFMFDGAAESQLGLVKAAGGAITSMALLGAPANSSTASSIGDSSAQQVWAASERSISVLDAASGALLFSLAGDADAGFVKALLPWGWGTWVLGTGSLRQLAVRAAWDSLRLQVGGAASSCTATAVSAAAAGQQQTRQLHVGSEEVALQRCMRGDCAQHQPPPRARCGLTIYACSCKYPMSDECTQAGSYCD
jgi:hypothetical protein